MYDLNETIELMTATDYKDRLKAEYWQTKIRYDKLCMMLEKYEAGKLDFKPTCPIDLLEEQREVMADYSEILIERAFHEGLDLEKDFGIIYGKIYHSNNR